MLEAEIKELIKNLDGQCSIIVNNMTHGEKFALMKMQFSLPPA